MRPSIHCRITRSSLQQVGPKKKDRTARAILALALKNGGLDLADGSTANRTNLAKREYHHLFPDAHLQRKSVSDDKIYCSMNCALVTWRTNRTISDKPPERYLAERREGTDLSEADIAERLESHLIPYSEMVAGEYDEFLNARAELIVGAMQKMCRSASGGEGEGLAMELNKLMKLGLSYPGVSFGYHSWSLGIYLETLEQSIMHAGDQYRVRARRALDDRIGEIHDEEYMQELNYIDEAVDEHIPAYARMSAILLVWGIFEFTVVDIVRYIARREGVLGKPERYAGKRPSKSIEPLAK